MEKEISVFIVLLYMCVCVYIYVYEYFRAVFRENWSPVIFISFRGGSSDCYLRIANVFYVAMFHSPLPCQAHCRSTAMRTEFSNLPQKIF